MMSEAAHGTIRAQRTSRRPGKLLSRNWASPSEIAMVTPTTTATHTSVFTSDARQRVLLEEPSRSCRGRPAPWWRPVIE